jgi:long-chain acyl-CoA synthetase
LTALDERSSVPQSDRGARSVASHARDRARSMPGAVAMREKDFGIWQEITWEELWQTVVDLGHGLIALGIEPGDRVSIHSEDRPEWVMLDLAAVAVRATSVGLYPTNPPAEVAYLLGDSGAKVHLVEDQEQADKVLSVIDGLPALEKIVYVEPRGFRHVREDSRFMSWEDLVALGRSHRVAHPHAVEDRMAAALADDVMTLVYTSGTTGPPKGAMLTNSNFEYTRQILVDAPGRFPKDEKANSKDQILTYLPLCHVAERIFSTWTMAATGAVLNFAESIETVQENLREIQPTLFFAVPRIWEKIHAGIRIKAADASLFKKLWLGVGFRLADFVGGQRIANGGKHTVTGRMVYALGYPLVFRALRERIGMRRCRWAGTGAAPIAPEVIRFFHGLGLDMFELYGMTENSAVATYNPVGNMKLGTVGVPYPGIGFRIDPDTGEIQTKHAGVFAGYWNKQERTAETFTPDGWLKTGDVGEWVDGTHVKIVDRMKDIIITSGGKNISPSEIENSLKTSPFIKEAMVTGDGRNYLAALIAIEMDTVGDWATRRGIPYTTYRDLTEKREVLELVQGVVDKTNENLARVENIRKFRLIPKELDHEDGELTATQKLKRSAMEKRFADLIDSMYTRS